MEFNTLAYWVMKLKYCEYAPRLLDFATNMRQGYNLMKVTSALAYNGLLLNANVKVFIVDPLVSL